MQSQRRSEYSKMLVDYWLNSKCNRLPHISKIPVKRNINWTSNGSNCNRHWKYHTLSSKCHHLSYLHTCQKRANGGEMDKSNRNAYATHTGAHSAKLIPATTGYERPSTLRNTLNQHPRKKNNKLLFCTDHVFWKTWCSSQHHYNFGLI